MAIFEVSTMELILLSVIGILFFIQLIYYSAFYNKINRLNNKVKHKEISFIEKLPPLSVVIYTKNESHNLREFLPSVLEQDYPEYEVIVVNNNSSDESEELLAQFSKQYNHLYHSFTPENSRGISHKKLGLTLGIKASKHDWIVLTDANCYPVSKNWLKLMARNFTASTDVVLGYSGYERGKSWFHKRVSYDTLFTAMRYLGFAIAGKPYMGIGRNMAYRKELFFKEKGFSSHLNLQKGDDDLFINQIAKKRNTRVVIEKDAVIRMKPVKYSIDWIEEKASYMANGKLYKGGQRKSLGFETLTRLLFYAAVIFTVTYAVLNQNWIVAGIAGGIWLLRFIIQASIINSTAKVLGESRRYYITLPFFDFIQPIQSLYFKLYRKRRRRVDIKYN